MNTGEVFYIGKGKGRRYKIISGRNKFFLDMYKTHECGVRKIFENLTEEEAFAKEKEMIKYYRDNTNYRLTNQTDGGDGVSGMKLSEERKAQASIESKARWQNKEFRERMTAIRNDPNGVYKSKEFRQKISELTKGEKNPNYGNNWTDEKKRNLSLLRINKKLAAGVNNPKAKKIICMETGETFDLIRDAAKKYNIKNATAVTIALKEPYRTAGGVHWSVYDENLEEENNRFEILINSIANSSRSPVCGVDTKEIYNTRKDFLIKYNIGVKYFLKHYSPKDGIEINNNKYMYARDYVSRTHE